MKRYTVLTILQVFIFASVFSQNVNLQNTVNNVVNQATGGATLTTDEIVKGLKEALTVGTNSSTASASKVDGFLKNTKIKIPFPADAKAMETKLRAMGMGDQCDKFIESINRGAEEAVKSAAPIFLDAITNLSITDGLSILKGSNDAATKYLKDNTTASLKIKFKPIVEAALKKVEVTKYWNPLTTKYNKLPLVTKVNPNLDDYVTGKAIDGLFVLIAEQELLIRTDAGSRISDILKKVFG